MGKRSKRQGTSSTPAPAAVVPPAVSSTTTPVSAPAAAAEECEPAVFLDDLIGTLFTKGQADVRVYEIEESALPAILPAVIAQLPEMAPIRQQLTADLDTHVETFVKKFQSRRAEQLTLVNPRKRVARHVDTPRPTKARTSRYATATETGTAAASNTPPVFGAETNLEELSFNLLLHDEASAGTFSSFIESLKPGSRARSGRGFKEFLANKRRYLLLPDQAPLNAEWESALSQTWQTIAMPTAATKKELPKQAENLLVDVRTIAQQLVLALPRYREVLLGQLSTVMAAVSESLQVFLEGDGESDTLAALVKALHQVLRVFATVTAAVTAPAAARLTELWCGCLVSIVRLCRSLESAAAENTCCLIRAVCRSHPALLPQIVQQLAHSDPDAFIEELPQRPLFQLLLLAANQQLGSHGNLATVNWRTLLDQLLLDTPATATSSSTS
jgi:hypothetical protein